MNDGALRHQAILKVHDAIVFARQAYGIDMPFPTILFNITGRAAGQANGTKNLIRFNMALLSQNGEEFLNRTPVHEAAHLINRKLNGSVRRNGRRVIKVHGPEWKSIMRLLGAEASRCHTFDTTNAKVRQRSKGAKYPYKCQCMDYPLGATRHKRVLQGAVYRCRKCNSPLVYQGV